jgi:plasmid stabilization system protein ParE
VRIRLSPRALRQLDEILSYIEAENPEAATKVAAQIDQVISLLKLYPKLGRTSDHTRLRAIPTGRYPYVVIYSVSEGRQEIRIAAIRHAARRPGTL